MTTTTPKTKSAPASETSLPQAGTEEKVTAASPQPQIAPADSSSKVAGFIRSMRSAPEMDRGRLIFAMDATLSRQPTWDMALGVQADMFDAVREIGGLDVQLVYFRGAGECRASPWVGNPETLARFMTTVSCQGGYTQIGKVLARTRQEHSRQRVSALVYVGDCIEEDADDLCGRAGQLALAGVPVFVFQEGSDAQAEQTFRQIARIAKGAFCRFDAGSAGQLRELLSAVAVYAAGGRRALEALGRQRIGNGARLLLGQIK
ncbi:MAG: VWA domain-containing protein [Hyphomicrobiaceae bacterium]